MDMSFTIATLARRGLLAPGSPAKVLRQLAELRRWGFGLGGELRSAAARDPDGIAIIDDRKLPGAPGESTGPQPGRLTYGELLSRAERLATALHGACGVQPTDKIGLLCRNHGGLIEGMVAASLLGADAVLVNTGLSPAQLAVVAEEQRLRILIHDSEFTEHAVALPRKVERLDETGVEEVMATAPPGGIRRPQREGRLIVLTSGTTGAPKGARRRTPGGFAPLASIISRIPLNARSRMLIAAPVFHTWGLAALQMGLALRATIVLQRRFDPAEALAGAIEHDCTSLFAVPVMLQRLLEVPPRPTPLKVVAVSGSALPGGLATRFMDVHGDVLYNLYGSTEASWASIATPQDLRKDSNTAGRPPHGTRIAIVSQAGREMAPGQTGRIFVANDMVFEGYTNGAGRETLDGLLATGDLGHVDSDGLLFVDGREDDMIVSGGENVFPSEVENVLAALPQVREVAVVGVPDSEFGQRLAAWIALQPGEILDPTAVREYVRRHLARFAVPRDVRFVRALPRNATGKVVPRDLPW
ncbi:AMP-binding protein [Rugosimonospora africana]|uniref:AMP-binding protein n=1 Tax=Rugosimonospora africana TaxID=556532 RepID=UPI0019436A0E|nr:AMP-binding protein [Rugosimonospora africana]